MEIAYRSVAKETKVEFIEKKSKFIGHVSPVQTIEEAEAFINKICNEHPTATHNVWAYRIGLSGEKQRFSDDGEPSQTAGMPTLDVILKQDITQLVIVTTRYFGGILLGAGGLVRAYSKAAADVLLEAGIVSYTRQEKYRFKIGYSEWGIVQNHCEKRGWPLIDLEYLESVSATVIIPQNQKESLSGFLQDISGGEVLPVFLSSIYLPITK